MILSLDQDVCKISHCGAFQKILQCYNMLDDYDDEILKNGFWTLMTRALGPDHLSQCIC